MMQQRVLLPSIAQKAQNELGGDCVFSIPHRDTLLIAPASSPSLCSAVLARANDAASRAPHRISSGLWKLNLSDSGHLHFESFKAEDSVGDNCASRP
ncbi:MAG: hypothetical protein IPJ88_14305 [Myxococcales bacterium]|nr:MAG: hypothetical protein IPJ88_14305 [Myxococcales bacterium]